MEVLILLAVLACPIVMGTMMFLMWRGMRDRSNSGTGHEDGAPARKVMIGDHREEAGT